MQVNAEASKGPNLLLGVLVCISTDPGGRVTADILSLNRFGTNVTFYFYSFYRFYLLRMSFLAQPQFLS
jgi:hypothetical protein